MSDIQSLKQNTPGQRTRLAVKSHTKESLEGTCAFYIGDSDEFAVDNNTGYWYYTVDYAKYRGPYLTKAGARKVYVRVKGKTIAP